jgi:hypothetical protein
MDVAHRVRLHQRLAELDEDLDRLVDRQRPLALEHLGQGLPLEELHRHVQAAVAGPTEVEDLDDVIVLDLADGGRLAAESLDRQVVARQLVVQHLDRDLAAQGHVLGLVDGPGGAVAEPLDQEVAVADRGADDRVARLVAQAGGAAVGAEECVARVLQAALLADHARR